MEKLLFLLGKSLLTEVFQDFDGGNVDVIAGVGKELMWEWHLNQNGQPKYHHHGIKKDLKRAQPGLCLMQKLCTLHTMDVQTCT